MSVQRSPTEIHNWVHKAYLQQTPDATPNQIAVDETVIRVNGHRERLYAAVIQATNEIRHMRLFQALTTENTAIPA